MTRSDSWTSTFRSSLESRSDRQVERERAAFSACALDVNASVMRFDDAFRDGEPKANARAVGAAPLPVAVEDVFELLCRDAASGIRDGEVNVSVFFHSLHANDSAV